MGGSKLSAVSYQLESLDYQCREFAKMSSTEARADGIGDVSEERTLLFSLADG
jgi:hypothetical protein